MRKIMHLDYTIDFDQEITEEMRNQFDDKMFELVESFGATCCGMTRIFTEEEYYNE